MKCPLESICDVNNNNEDRCYAFNGRDFECCPYWCKFKYQLKVFCDVSFTIPTEHDKYDSRYGQPIC